MDSSHVYFSPSMQQNPRYFLHAHDSSVHQGLSRALSAPFTPDPLSSISCTSSASPLNTAVFIMRCPVPNSTSGSGPCLQNNLCTIKMSTHYCIAHGVCHSDPESTSPFSCALMLAPASMRVLDSAACPVVQHMCVGVRSSLSFAEGSAS
jgi:hypothetical protein